MRKLVVATRNEGKVREFIQLLAGLPFKIVSLAQYPDCPEVEETGTTFEENAVLKAVAAAEHTGELAIADDSGLEVDALDGAPSVWSSRFAPTTAARNSKLLRMMESVPDDKRGARFRCVIAIAQPGRLLGVCDGAVDGVIAKQPRGEHGFGYDPVFFIPSLGKHMAELLPDEKGAISHRGIALRKAAELLRSIAHEANGESGYDGRGGEI